MTGSLNGKVPKGRGRFPTRGILAAQIVGILEVATFQSLAPLQPFVACEKFGERYGFRARRA